MLIHVKETVRRYIYSELCNFLEDVVYKLKQQKLFFLYIFFI